MATTRNSTPDNQTRARRLREFLHDCAGSESGDEGARVREALLELGGSGVEGTGPLDVAAIHAMLNCGATTSAVLAIMGPDACFMLSRGAQNSCLASVIQNNGTEEALAEGATLALALLSAHVAAVLARTERSRNLTEMVPEPISVRLH